MRGYHEFELDCTQWGYTLPEFGLILAVEYDVDLCWNDGVEMEAIRPVKVTSIVAGNATPGEEWRDIVGPLKGWILAETAKLGLEQLGITDREAKEELGNVEDHAELRRELAAGRI